MNWQLAFTAVIVAACATYAVWFLLPASLRRRLRLAMTGAPTSPIGDNACGPCGCCGDGASASKQVAPDGARQGAVIRFSSRPRASEPATPESRS